MENIITAMGIMVAICAFDLAIVVAIWTSLSWWFDRHGQ